MKDLLYISEVYSAIQGEGPLVGVKQIFIRLSACDLRCQWCDTPDSLTRTKSCRVESTAGSRKFENIQNPVTVEQINLFISKLSPNLHHSISFTGGEPLLQSEALSLTLPAIKEKFTLPLYLETGGHRPDNLKEVISSFDYVSMDFKLPSSSKTEPLWNEHSEFLSICLNSKSLKSVWVKIVVTSSTLLDELIFSVNLIKDVTGNKPVEVFIQPVSKINSLEPPTPEKMFIIQSELLKIYPYIRVIPQVHKLIGQR